MKKITILSLHLDYGGIEKSIIALANILVKKYDVEIACIYKLNEQIAFELDDKVKVTFLLNNDLAKRMRTYKSLLTEFHFLKLIRKIFEDYFFKLKFIPFFKDIFDSIFIYHKRKKVMKKFLQSCNSDIIISTRTFLNKWLGELANKNIIKIGWEHNHHNGNMKYATQVIKSAKNLNYFVLVSKNLYDFYKDKLKVYNCTCVFIPNILEQVPKKLAALEEKRLITIGRLCKEKGYLDLLKVMTELIKKYPDWNLDIIGDGPEKNNLENYIKSQNLEKNVCLHGFRDKKYIDKLLQKSSIYIMTSYTESFGIVLLEAMSHGVPCIAYDSAEGATELIANNKNGYLIKNRNQDSMLKKIEELINDKQKRITLGKKSRENALNYTPDIIGEKWFSLIERSNENG